jgi:hypothetical protein
VRSRRRARGESGASRRSRRPRRRLNEILGDLLVVDQRRLGDLGIVTLGAQQQPAFPVGGQRLVLELKAGPFARQDRPQAQPHGSGDPIVTGGVAYAEKVGAGGQPAAVLEREAVPARVRDQDDPVFVSTARCVLSRSSVDCQNPDSPLPGSIIARVTSPDRRPFRLVAAIVTRAQASAVHEAAFPCIGTAGVCLYLPAIPERRRDPVASPVALDRPAEVRGGHRWPYSGSLALRVLHPRGYSASCRRCSWCA